MDLSFVFVHNFKFKCMFVAFFKPISDEKSYNAFIT